MIRSIVLSALAIGCGDPSVKLDGDSVALAAEDRDGDGYAEDQDCDESDAGVHPGATEVCDGADQDCDGVADDGAAPASWHADGDGDGYGAGDPVEACEAPAGFVDRAGDCDDGDSAANPGAQETCAIGDEDCDGLVNDEDGTVAGAGAWFLDGDGDGYGAGEPQNACEPPAGTVSEPGDCDDDAPEISPAETERCNGVDDDCDGQIDDGAFDATTWHTDADADGVGDDASAILACEQPAGCVATAGDCDDTDASANPSVVETCGDGVDNNCDGSAVPCGLGGTISLGLEHALTGTAAGVQAGYSVATADVTGDGIADVLTGQPFATSSAGAAVVFPGPVTADASLSAGWEISGESSSDFAGYAACAADVDGDGVSDLVVGAPGVGAGLGRAYVVAGPIAADGAFGGAGVVIDGWPDAGAFGSACVDAGDFDGDGLWDFGLGAPSLGSSAGSVFLFSGGAAASGDASSADLRLEGEGSGHLAGTALANAGDVDGDGIEDLLVGAPGASGSTTSAGSVYLLLLPASGSVGLSSADLRIDGTGSLDYLGRSASGGADVDGDGLPDVLLGAPYQNDGGGDAGAAYLFASFGTGTTTVGSATASLIGEDALDEAGRSAQVVGDMDGDGYAEVAVGATQDDDGGSASGSVYVLYGPLSGTIDLAATDAKLVGEAASDEAGWALGRGDVNDDGWPDLLVGARNNGDAGAEAGAVYVVPGGGL